MFFSASAAFEGRRDFGSCLPEQRQSLPKENIPCGEHTYPEIGARSNAHDGTRAASCFVVDAHSATLLYSEEGEMQKHYKFARARRCDERLRLLDDVATAETRMKTVHHPPC